MKSYKVRKLENSKIEIFFKEHKKIYALTLKELLGCSYSHARSVIAKIKKEKGIKTNYLNKEDLKEYLDLS